MSADHKYIAAFDMDKTILTINSSRMVVKVARKTGLMNTRDFLQAIYYSIVYKLDLKDANEIVQEMTAWLRGLKEADVKTLVEKYVIPELISLIRPEIREEMAMHRKNKGRLVLLSSAIPYLCEPIAEHLKMDAVVCSRLMVNEGRFTGKSDRRLVFGKEKALRMEEYCKGNGFPLDTAWYYGDAFTDRFVMKAVGNPVAVKPEIKLGMMAKKRAWKII